MHYLRNHRTRYDWGSVDAISRFTGELSDGGPIAEEWMGTHPLGASMVLGASGEERPLSEVAGGPLPFMMKLLAADRPLSIQVHPSPEIAAVGYAADDAAQIALDDPARTYKDPHHKPEMVFALTTFDTLVGFRPTAEILRILNGLPLPLAKRLSDALTAKPGFAGIVELVRDLLSNGVAAAEIEALVDQCRERVDDHIDIKRAYATVVAIAEHHPGDVGLVVSLLLNRLTLQPGEAAFLADGIIHAHLSGMCVEVMASSDNVLRGGLTSKFVNPPELVRCLDAGMSRLARVTPIAAGPSTDLFAPDVAEFALAVAQVGPADVEGVKLPRSEHRIVVCTGGEIEVQSRSGDRAVLKRGQSVYAPADDGQLTIFGVGEAVQSHLPAERTTSLATGTLVDLV